MPAGWPMLRIGNESPEGACALCKPHTDATTTTTTTTTTPSIHTPPPPLPDTHPVSPKQPSKSQDVDKSLARPAREIFECVGNSFSQEELSDRRGALKACRLACRRLSRSACYDNVSFCHTGLGEPTLAVCGPAAYDLPGK